MGDGYINNKQLTELLYELLSAVSSGRHEVTTGAAVLVTTVVTCQVSLLTLVHWPLTRVTSPTLGAPGSAWLWSPSPALARGPSTHSHGRAALQRRSPGGDI